MANDAVFGGNRQHVSSDEAVPSLKKVDSRVHPAPRQMRQKHCRSLHQPQEIGFELATFAGNQLVKYLVHFDFAVILAKHFWLGTTFQTR